MAHEKTININGRAFRVRLLMAAELDFCETILAEQRPGDWMRQLLERSLIDPTCALVWPELTAGTAISLAQALLLLNFGATDGQAKTPAPA